MHLFVVPVLFHRHIYFKCSLLGKNLGYRMGNMHHTYSLHLHLTPISTFYVYP